MHMVLVVWEDARVLTDGAWSDKQDHKYEPYLVQQVGFLLKKTKKFLHLTEAIAPNHYGPVEQIPRGMVREIHYLNKCSNPGILKVPSTKEL